MANLEPFLRFCLGLVLSKFKRPYLPSVKATSPPTTPLPSVCVAVEILLFVMSLSLGKFFLHLHRPWEWCRWTCSTIDPPMMLFFPPSINHLFRNNWTALRCSIVINTKNER